MYNEKFRPQFHFSARENWMNDPNGLFFYNGTYHLFFQHNPFGLEWGNMTWGHAVSTDLVHWWQLKNELEPDQLGTMFSGSAVIDWENTSSLGSGSLPPIVLIYTAAGGYTPESKNQPFTQCLAYSVDGGETWEKYSQNPILTCQREGNRDPKVIWHAPTHRWMMTLYLNKNDFAFFSSPDLIHWTFLHEIKAPDSIECPDFFKLKVDGTSAEYRWVWMAGNGRYYIGQFDGQRYTPETELLIGDWGANFYACQSYSDIPREDGRRIQIAWMNGGKYPGMPFNQQQSFPCELRLIQTSHGLRLTRYPVKEIENLYANKFYFANQVLNSQIIPLDISPDGLWDIHAVVKLGDAREVGLIVHGARVSYQTSSQELTCIGCSAQLEPIDGRVHLRLLADRTSLEVFGNQGLVSMTSCFLPEPENYGLQIYSEDGRAEFEQITIHELRSSWPED